MSTLHLAFLPLARSTFDIPFAEEVTAQARQNLHNAGFELHGPEGLITSLEAAQAAAQALSRQALDLAVIFQATFADSSMVNALAHALEAPLFLWAVPEAATGGRLRLNSLCGINLAGHSLTLQRIPYDYVLCPPQDPAVIAQLRPLAKAGQVRRLLRQARLGVIGEHPPGMDTCHLDAPRLKEKLGIEVRQIPLPEAFSRARQQPRERIQAVRQELDQHLPNLSNLDQTALNGSLSVYAALRQIAEEERLDGLAVRCWPEFFTELGCAACGAMSMLTDDIGRGPGLPCSCEADINGTVTQLILQWLADAPAFGSDLVAMDFEQDTSVFWHCGLAPLSFADPSFQPRGALHSNRKLPLVMEFPLKPGIVTLARLNQSTGELRMVQGRGEMLAHPPAFSGTSGVLRFERPARQIFDVLMSEGLEHHLSLVYGDHLAALQAFTRLAGLPALNL